MHVLILIIPLGGKYKEVIMKKTVKETYLWLNSMGISSRSISNIEENILDIRNIWDLSSKEIYNIKGIQKVTKDKILAKRNRTYLEKLFRILELNSHINILSIDEETYPERLLDIYDPPKVLYYIGRDIFDTPSISIVGSRKMTSYGQWATEKFSRELSTMGVTIVSGLALGIDSIAHRTCLKSGGTTIGVIGNGLNIVYPNKNKDLYQEIPKNGAIVSGVFLGVEPLPHHFPNRNRIISGLASGVLIIEATKKSGSLITGQHGLEQGKDVFALPGNINSIFSEGTNRLITDGAKMVLRVEDIVEEIREFKLVEKKKDMKDIDLSLDERKVLEEIGKRPIGTDEIAAILNKNIRDIMSILTILEIKGLVKEVMGNKFTLS